MLHTIIVNRSGNVINAGSYNVVIDATAATAFAFDGTTITVKATQFVGNIITTATITQSNGATIYGGYQDSTGTYKFLDLEWTGNTSPLNVSVVNLDDNSNILPPTSATNSYTSHFVMPSPVPTSGTEVRITSSSGTILYNQVIPTDDFDFINLRVALNDVSSEENQHKILRLAERLLAKSEAINNSLTGSTTPTITINETITNVLNYGTLKNQEAILGILIRLLNQVSATRESYKQ